MNTKLQRFVEQLAPFIIIGFGIALGVGLMIIFTYILLGGLMIGALLWSVFVIRNFFLPKQSPSRTTGRVIEHSKKI